MDMKSLESPARSSAPHFNSFAAGGYLIAGCPFYTAIGSRKITEERTGECENTHKTIVK